MLETFPFRSLDAKGVFERSDIVSKKSSHLESMFSDIDRKKLYGFFEAHYLNKDGSVY